MCNDETSSYGEPTLVDNSLIEQPSLSYLAKHGVKPSYDPAPGDLVGPG